MFNVSNEATQLFLCTVKSRDSAVLVGTDELMLVTDRLVNAGKCRGFLFVFVVVFFFFFFPWFFYCVLSLG